MQIDKIKDKIVIASLVFVLSVVNKENTSAIAIAW
jgi:hypothetical protein